MKVPFRMLVAFLVALGMGSMSTARAGITLVISVSDANGSATETISNTSNTLTFGDTNGAIVVTVGSTTSSSDTPSSVFSDFTISATGSATFSSGSNNSQVTDQFTVDYTNQTGTGGSSGHVNIGVFPINFTGPGTMGTSEYVSSVMTLSNGVYNSISFVTSVAQSAGTFTPGFQSITTDPNTGVDSTGKIYSNFNRSGPDLRLYNSSDFNLPVDSSGGSDAVAGTATSTLSLAKPTSGNQTTPIPTPEPSTLVMALAGLPVIGLIAWRRRRATGPPRM